MSRALAAITGASAGIGAEFAKQLARRGYNLLLIARRRDRLEGLAEELAAAHGITAEVMTADLGEESDIERVAARLRESAELALLVNNAGFGTKGRFWEASLESQAQMHRVHIDAILRVTHGALGGMVNRRRGGVISVSSVAGFLRSPANVSYCATKSWINAFMEGLYLELRGIGSPVQVQALCPGFTYSEFHDVMGANRAGIPAWLWYSAAYVVEESLRGLDRGKLYVVPGWQYKLAVGLLPKLPVRVRVWLEGAGAHTKDRV